MKKPIPFIRIKSFKIRKTAILMAMLSLAACVEDLAIDPGSAEAVAVDCVLKMQETQTLRLYRLKESYGSEAQAIEDATVTLSAYDSKSGDFLPVAEFEHSDGMEWRATYMPKYGVAYRLTVNVSGNDPITAETRFPADLKLVEDNEYITVKDLTSYFGIQDSAQFCVSSYKIYKNVRLVNKEEIRLYQDSCKLWVFPHVDSEQSYSGYQFHGASEPYVKLVATDHPFVDKFNLVTGSVSELEWCNHPIIPIEQQYYSPFMKFRIYNISQWPIIICPDLPLHDSFLRIAHPADFENHSDPYRPDQGFYIIADYSETYHDRSLGKYPIAYCIPRIIETHFVSEEYDAYLKDLYAANADVDNFILSAYEVKHIRSNVAGGYGIFGADNITWDEYGPHYVY